MSSFAPAVFVLETHPCWEAELKRGLAGERTLVRPCRSVADLLALCRSMPGSVAVIDLEVGDEAALRCLALVSGQRLIVSPVIIASARALDLEWPLREFGAIAVLPESIRGEQLARLCRRLLPRQPSSE